MGIQEALQKFGYCTIEDVTKENLKQKYRGIMKSSHPDLRGGNSEFSEYTKSVNEAHDIIKKALDDIEKDREKYRAQVELEKALTRPATTSRSCTISLKELTEIYSGQCIKKVIPDGDRQEVVSITSKNLLKLPLAVRIDVSIYVDGEHDTESFLQPVDSKREYEVVKGYSVDDTTSSVDIGISVESTERFIREVKGDIVVRLPIGGNGVVVNLRLERRAGNG